MILLTLFIWSVLYHHEKDVSRMLFTCIGHDIYYAKTPLYNAYFEARTNIQFSSVQSLSRVRLFVTPWISMPGLLVHHQLPELTQTHVHRVSDAIQLSHPLPSPSPPAPNPSQNQGLFQWVNSLHEVAKVLGVSASASVLPMNTQDWSPLGWIGWISLQSKGLSRVFSNTTIQKNQFFSTQLSSQSNSHIHTWPLEKP